MIVFCHNTIIYKACSVDYSAERNRPCLQKKVLIKIFIFLFIIIFYYYSKRCFCTSFFYYFFFKKTLFFHFFQVFIIRKNGKKMLNKIDFANEKENIQRKKIKELTLHSDYLAIFSNEKYDRADGRLINYINGKRYELETKWYGDGNNKRNSNKYPNYQIDFEKLIYLEKKAKENNSTPLLIVFFSNELVVWNINLCDWKSTKKNVKVNKIGGKYGKEKEESQQVYLMLSDAIYRNKNITPFS